MKYSLSEIAEACGGRLVGSDVPCIDELLTDSRRLFVPERTIFVALRGERHDGHDYISDLYSRGMRAFMCEEPVQADKMGDASFVVVGDTLAALQKLAGYHRKKSKARVLAVCGSNGKTIVKEWLSQLVGGDMMTVRSPRSYNSQVGVPLSVLKIEEQTELAIIETGISKMGEMTKLNDIVLPDDVIVTNIGGAHQENFPSVDVKLREKLDIAEGAKRIYFCADQKDVASAIRRRFPSAELIGWGTDPYVDYVVKSEQSGDGCQITVAHGGETMKFSFFMTDQMSIENISHTIVYAIDNGIDKAKVAERLLSIEPVGMRLEQKEGHNGCLIIDDAYNADLTSTEVALDMLHVLGDKKGLTRTVILSDMQETGLPDSVLYKRVERLLVEKKIDRLIGIGQHITDSLSALQPSEGQRLRMQFFGSTEDFLRRMSTADFSHEAILLKGQRKFGFERISVMLENMRNRTVMQVNLASLAHNIAHFRSFLKPGVKLLAMVKAHSYGTGSFEIAKVMQQQGVDYLGVAFADEGVELREAGISMPIAVMNPEVHSFDLMLAYDLEPQIYGFEELEAYSQAVSRSGAASADVHIKFNTGMTRSGFEPEEAADVAQRLKEVGNLRVVSAFSHLVESEDPRADAGTLRQIEMFKGACEVLMKEIGYKFDRHILNSAGIERFSEHQMEMVRLGIGLYGLSAVDNSRLQNVVTLKSYVSLVRNVKAGETVGYNRRTRLTRDSKIAIVPIGYADGVDRRLSNGVGRVLIRGQFSPIAGNVCMDIIMVDVTDIAGVKAGDSVELFGDTDPVWNMASRIGTICYEILTGIGRRVKRVYYVE
ncbi:MAG: bifunctional UDP-N-acetylmuramoyl-tripeptide:D-alanyl-D-alanine ligase/alanine racemase [Bacteroidales bacterium]|nr:bifunctional UDP-N-acetylmuramoyl-tripeptide:D-alanyl-D-alanine ligase/alanine racemase [Bacteroidales bacterium]